MSYSSSPPALTPHNISRQGTPYFVGREQELTVLHQELYRRGRVTLEACEGLTGLGKAELALQYAYTHLEDYPGGICWLQGHLGHLEDQVIEFAKGYLHLEVPQTLQGHPLSSQQQLDWCWQHWHPDGRVLLIIDGATDLASCRAVLLAPANRFHILVTTLKPDLLPYSHTLKVTKLTPEAGYQLLTWAGQNRLGTLDQEAALALSQWFNHLPLAIKLLGAYLSQHPELTLAEVQLRLEQVLHTVQPASPALAAPGSHQRVAALLELIWQDLKPDTQNLARLLSLLAPTLIPWHLVEWVLQAFWGSDYSLQSARQQLEAFRLVESAQSAVEGLHLHTDIKRFFQTKLQLESVVWIPQTELERALAAACAGIARQIPQILTPVRVAAVAPLVPHLAEVAQHQADQLSDENLIWPFIGLGRFYQAQGLYLLATPWWQACLTATKKRFGKNHADTAFSLNNLALLYQQQGHSHEAEPLYNQALDQFEQLLGEDSILAVGLSNLAGLYRSQGRLEEAEALYQRSLEMSQHLDQDPATLVTNLNNLAELYRLQGRLGEAEPLYQEALATAQQELGQAHHLVPACLNNLAELHRAQERYREAEALHLRALKLRRQRLGKDHSAIAASLNNLAELYRCQGRYRKAERLHVQSLEMTRRLWGEDHPAVATGLNNLAVLYACVNRFDKAISLLEQALEKRRKLLGEAHPDTHRTLQNLEHVKAARQ